MVRRLCGLVLVSVLTLLSGCSPAFNWREVAVGNTRLLAMFPCKPETAQQRVSMADQEVALTMRSCKAGGVTLAVGHARLTKVTDKARVLARWRDATLASVGAEPASISAVAPSRLQPLPDLVAVRANGTSPGGSPVLLQGLWFAQDSDVFSALLVAGKVSADDEESFFSGLRFR